MKRLLLPAAALLVLALAWVGVRGLLAQRALTDARGTLAVAQEALLDRRVPEARDAAAEAGEQTRRARGLTGDVVWTALAAVPVAGRSLDTARAVAVAADDVARDVLPPLLDVAAGLDPESLRTPDGRVDLALVQRLSRDLDRASGRTSTVVRDLRASPSRAVPGPVAEARAELLGQARRLDARLSTAATAAEVAPVLLGAEARRRFLVLVQQTGESRGTGGLVGGYALVETQGGAVRVPQTGARGARLDVPIDVPPGTPRDFVERYGPNGVFRFGVNVNLSPDLPQVARLVQHRWTKTGGAPLDGVVMVDAKALALLLRGTGPVDVGGGRTVAPEQLEQYLAVGQYEGLSVARAEQQERKSQLTAVAAAAVQRLTSPGATEPLLRGLVAAVSSGHVRMSSELPALQPVLARTGLDGALPRGEAPVAYPVVVNASAGKLDTFLTRSVRYTAGPCEGPRRRSVIEVTLRSDLPAQLPPYLTINLDAPGDQSRTNRLLLAVYGTRGAELESATLDGEPLSLVPAEDGGRPELKTQREAGLPVWDVFLDLPPEQERVLRLEVDEPTAAGAPRVPEQPLATELRRTVEVPVCS